MNKLLAKRPKQFSERVYLQLTGNLPEPNINRKQGPGKKFRACLLSLTINEHDSNLSRQAQPISELFY